VRRPAAKQMPVAVLTHPAGASEMCLPCASGALGLAVRVKVQHDPRDLGPVGAILLGVQQAVRHSPSAPTRSALHRRHQGQAAASAWVELAARLLSRDSRRVSAPTSRPELRTTWCIIGITKPFSASAHRGAAEARYDLNRARGGSSNSLQALLQLLKREPQRSEGERPWLSLEPIPLPCRLPKLQAAA
jgi:hypothetical protein